MPRISIIGCGWLGLPLGAELVAAGYDVKGSTTSEEKIDDIAAAGILPFLVRIEPNFVSGDLERCLDADIVFVNLPPGRRRGQGEGYAERVLQLRTHIEITLPSFVIFASSTSVYPDTNDVVTEEDAGEEGDSLVYRAERAISNEAPFDVTILRFAGLYGYARHPAYFLAGRKNIPGANAPVNLVHRDDCIAVIRRVIERGARRAVYNVCSDEHPPRGAFYTRLARAMDLEPPRFTGEQKPFKIVSNEKLKRELSFEFRYSSPYDGP